MSDIIRVLPDVVANQIAAGEVIQRPASVIKELVENAVDAGSDRIQVITKDAGKTLIQVVDNGCGMSETDARLSFERHATSKIRKAEDLFSIRTMGFRGEALASIASIAQVELKTKRQEDETGTQIRIEGSEILYQQPVACSNGTSFQVKNLFYNVPARRRFLKSTSTELKHIITEFQRVALTQPEVAFSLHHNDTEIFNLPASGYRERIIKLMGKQLDANLVNISTETSIVKIKGFIGKPEKAKKTYGEQFFFVNGRFMKHPYLHKAVMLSYEAILPQDTIPSYFIYLDIDPEHVDINIHPTKTEIKFDEERAIFQILQASVREGLGKFNLTPSLDFNQEGAIDIPVLSGGSDFNAPEIEINPDFNPFDSYPDRSKGNKSSGNSFKTQDLSGWENLYPPPDKQQEYQQQQELFDTSFHGQFIQVKSKYLVTPVKSGLMIIHIRRALERIEYEQLLASTGDLELQSQKLLYPVQFELGAADFSLLNELLPELIRMGFEIEEFGGSSIIIHAIPTHNQEQDVKAWFEHILDVYKSETHSLSEERRNKLLMSLARANSRISKTSLSVAEMAKLFDQLFQCTTPNKTPNGKTILTILQSDELEQRFL